MCYIFKLYCIAMHRRSVYLLQERLAKSHGSQCGFCTPGIVRSMYTLLRNSPQPSAEQMEKAFEGMGKETEGVTDEA